MTEPVVDAPVFRAVDMLTGTVAEVCGEDCDCREGESS